MSCLGLSSVVGAGVVGSLPPLPPSEQEALLSGKSAVSRWQEVRSASGMTVRKVSVTFSPKLHQNRLTHGQRVDL